MDFYQELSPIYDDMINFRERLKTEKKIYQNILEKFPAKSALDAGCGSGFHTIMLSQLKLKVTGFDNSDQMLNLARENFKNYRIKSLLIKGDFLSLNKNLINSFDSVFCLGNSFVHLLSKTDQIKALLNFRKYLKSEGYLCLQIINYDKVLKNRQEFLAKREVKDSIITRKYSFKKSTIIFKVTIEKENDYKEYFTELYPMRSEEILSRLRNARFKKLDLYGDLKLNSYQRFKSDNICVVCQ